MAEPEAAEVAEPEVAADGNVAGADDSEGALPPGVRKIKPLSREAAADKILDALTLQYLQTGGKRSRRERWHDETNRIIFCRNARGTQGPAHGRGTT